MEAKRIKVAGVETRYAEAGPADAPAILLIPPGLFGTGTLGGLFAPTLTLWDTALPALAGTNRVIALDTLGQGGTGIGTAEPTLDAALDHFAAFLDALGIGRAHLVGHDEGAMLAVRLAFRDPARIASCTIVSSPTVAPSGDGLNPLFLASPLEPRLSAQGQRWVLDRLSYTPHHATPALLEDAVSAGAPGAKPVQGDAMARLSTSITKAKGDNFARWRDEGFPVPAMVVWGTHDPASGIAHARSVLELIAARQTATQMHLLNRAGYFAYREQPRLFNGLVAGFVRAVEHRT
ncbi:MAG TPA: alpha/beta fold hydrolase [Roseomonas sp.]